MSATLQQRLAIATAVLFAFALTVTAQSSRFPAEGKYRNMGSKPYVVVRGDLTNFQEKYPPVVADADSEELASKIAQALNEALKGDDNYRYLYSWKKRSTDDSKAAAEPSPGKGRKIEFQKPKFVDIGSPKRGGEKRPVLAGKKGSGTIGKAKVTIEFGKDGKLTISGELAGKGKWSETETGGVYLETALSTFRGNIKGDTVSGLRFTKDSSRPLTEWSVDLSPSFTSFAGTNWVGETREYLELWKNGTGVIRRSKNSDIVPTDITWTQSGAQVTIQWKSGRRMVGNLKDGQLLFRDGKIVFRQDR